MLAAHLGRHINWVCELEVMCPWLRTYLPTSTVPAGTNLRNGLNLPGLAGTTQPIKYRIFK